MEIISIPLIFETVNGKEGKLSCIFAYINKGGDDFLFGEVLHNINTKGKGGFLGGC